jgi:F0F1-type ATP synthase assembly protein I
MAGDGRGDRSILNLLTVGTVLVACILTGYLLGSWLDRSWGTRPWMVVLGVLLGTAAGFLELFRTVSRSLK